MPDLRAAIDAIRNRTSQRPRLALILGSGLGPVADAVSDPTVIPSSDIPGYPQSSVKGHAGRLVVGELEGCPVVVVQGRVHAYEGHGLDKVTLPVRIVHGLGASHLLVTNAAGGINEAFPPGTLMWIRDHINWTGRWPDVPDGSAIQPPYDPDWRRRLREAASNAGIRTEEGVYLWTLGPSFETKAEIRAFRRLGADAVGMSTVPEVIQARALQMRVAGLSTITNPAAGLNTEPLGHEEVMEVGRQVKNRVIELVRLVAADVAAGPVGD